MQNLRAGRRSEREKKIVSEEPKLRSENSRVGKLSALILREALREHPYAHLHGTPETVGKITLPQIQAFYDRYYRPDNAHLVIVGCVDPAATLAEVQRRFGAIQGVGATPAPTVPALLDWGLAQEVSTSQDLAPGKAAVLAYALPPADSADALLLLLRDIPLYRRSTSCARRWSSTTRPRLKRGSVSACGAAGALVFWAGYLPYRRRATAFSLLAQARDRLARFDWLTADRLAAAKRAQLLALHQAGLSNAGRAWRLATRSATAMLARPSGDRWILSVTLEEVRQVYTRYVLQRQPTRVHLTPQKVPLWLTLFAGSRRWCCDATQGCSAASRCLLARFCGSAAALPLSGTASIGSPAPGGANLAATPYHLRRCSA